MLYNSVITTFLIKNFSKKSINVQKYYKIFFFLQKKVKHLPLLVFFNKNKLPVHNFVLMCIFLNKTKDILKITPTSINYTNYGVFFLNKIQIVLNKQRGFYFNLYKYTFFDSNTKCVVPNNIQIADLKYNSSSMDKYINTKSIGIMEFQFLRKNKVFNKGRYSRCRQNYRTGVYICMYLSVVSIFGLYFWFYKFSFNFTYLWWVFILFFGSFFLPKILKYRLYEPKNLFIKFVGFFRWTFFLIKSIF